MEKARKAGIALIVLGIAVCAGFFFASEDFTPDLGLKWNLRHMEVELKDKVIETFMDMSAFRERYPEYNDLDDQDLTLRLQTKFFSGMTLEDYRGHFLRGPVPVEPLSQDRAGGDPLMIRRDIKDLRVTEKFTRALMTADAIEYGLLKLTPQRVAFPYRYALFAGLGFVAIGAAALAFSGKKRYNT